MPKYRIDQLDTEDDDFELPEEYTRVQKIKRGQGRPNDFAMPKKEINRDSRPEKK